MLLSYLPTNAQSFSAISTSNITKLINSSIAWADLDNDGDLDFVASGSWKQENHVTTIYKNLGSDSFAVDSSIYITSGGWKTSAYKVYCADFNNDGWIDVLLIGSTTKLYRNQKGKGFRDWLDFTETGNYAALGDFNNDGLIDIAFAGAKTHNYIDFFENKGNYSFKHRKELQVEGGTGGNMDWGDYNNDGYPDLVVCGRIGTSEESRIYKNILGRSFVQLNISLDPAKESASRWADFNNDGMLDLFIVGRHRNAVLQFYVYRNRGNDRFARESNMTGLTVSQSALGDFDKDGDIDIIITGSPTVMNGSAGYYTPSTYYRRNISSSWRVAFSSVGTTLMKVFAGDIASVDYDNDNDLDFMLTGSTTTFGGGSPNKPTPQFEIYKNTDTTTNKPPSAPIKLAIKKENGATYLHWKQSTDDHTPSAGLTYNLVLGTATNPASIFSGEVNLSNGKLRRQKEGNLGLDTLTEISMLKLSFGTKYYVQIQAIDNSLVGSKFSDTITIPVRIQASLPDKIEANCGEKIVLPLEIFNKDSSKFKHSWFPTNGLSDPKTKNPFFIASESQFYKVTSTAPNGDKFIDSVYIDVDGITVEITKFTTATCGDTLPLSCKVSTPHTDTNFIYEWTPSAGLSDSGIANPKLALYHAQTFHLTVRSKEGCVVRDSVSVLPTPIIVDASDLTKPCEIPDTMHVVVNTSRSNLKYAWSPGKDVSDSTILEPLVNSTESKDFRVVVSDSTCRSSDSVRITVNPPAYKVEITKDTAIVCGNSLQMSTKVQSTYPDSMYRYTWSPATGLSYDTIAEPVVISYLPEEYRLMVTSSAGCQVEDTMKITILPLEVEVLDITKQCGVKDTFKVVTNAKRPNLRYTWTPPVTLSDTTEEEPSVSSTKTRYYTVSVTDSLCSATDSSLVTIIPADYKLDFSADKVLFTAPPFAFQTTNLTPDMSLYDFEWHWGDDSILVSNNPKVFHEYDENGLYTVQLFATKKNVGCPDTLIKPDFIYCTGKTNSIFPGNEKGLFALYPNPSTGIIHLEMEVNENLPANISIYNSLGQRVWTGKMLANRAELDLRHLPKGIYSISIQSDQLVISSTMVLK